MKKFTVIQSEPFCQKQNSYNKGQLTKFTVMQYKLK